MDTVVFIALLLTGLVYGFVNGYQTGKVDRAPNAAERCDTQLLLCQSNEVQVRDALNNLADLLRDRHEK